MLQVDTLEKLQIGGVDQWVRLRGRTADQPILLLLYGGPGVPIFPRIRDLGELAGLEQTYTVAYWEQRGTGKSYSTDIAQVLQETEERTRTVQPV